MNFEQIEPSNEPIIAFAAISPEKGATVLTIEYADEDWLNISSISADENGLFASTEDGRTIRDGNTLDQDTIDEILSLETVTANIFSANDTLLREDLALTIVQPANNAVLGI